ncbi:hypothetical protein [Cognatishimia sp. F0-27]|uniref:hypothetical protein n=1 Tax=Cognatishimia sp. F0-27 TaxID=2816855 RepID=UPI001D0C11C6|nr:hypothetical protein [Cognatishimia sp. F0-27]MCC1494341.1 hypothetical protein [Cognatishimia sp. F0-27]
MSSLIAMLSLYYLCDQAAAHGNLSPAEVTRCMANYDAIKLEFIDEAPARVGTPERAAQNRLGYAGFKAWEAINDDLVREMRRDARSRLGIG